MTTPAWAPPTPASQEPSLDASLPSSYSRVVTSGYNPRHTSETRLGIVRVSEVKGRDGASLASPSEQAERIRAACARDGLALVELIDELDVSGGAPLERRNGLRSAVEAVEAGTANVVVAAYFDRLVRSLRVQDELVSRVEAAGGQVLAVDVGQVTNGSAGQWLSGTMLGAVSEYQRRTTAERTAEAQAAAVARGVPPWPGTTPGYRRRPDGRYEPDESASAVREAFRMRATGAPIRDVRDHLRRHGIERSFSNVQKLLASRVVLGEIHFGDLANTEAHEPIVDAETWRRVQRIRVSRGRKPKSERLLARLGLLRCGSCGGRMVVSSSRSGRYPTYNCTHLSDCTRRMVIGAELVEGIVVEAVKARLADVEGRASAEQGAHEAADALARAQASYDAAMRVLDPLEPAAVERLAELREARDEAQERVDRLGGQRTAITISAAKDWDRLTLDERRALIRATVARVVVAPGRGARRVSIEFVGE
jgi:DNA invertase Pin-like site-specific DNA recombinase